jgi:phage I-like protein
MSKRTRASSNSHSINLPPLLDGDALSEWYHLLPKGVFQGRDGRGPYVLDIDAERAVIEAFSRLNCDLPIDYEHQSLDAREKSGPVPAAGWIKELSSREDGLWGRVEWTPAAEHCLKNKEYRYISPVFLHDRGGHVKTLTMAALTNTPNLHLQAAASIHRPTRNKSAPVWAGESTSPAPPCLDTAKSDICKPTRNKSASMAHDGLKIDSVCGTHTIGAVSANSVRFPTLLDNAHSDRHEGGNNVSEDFLEKLCSLLELGEDTSEGDILEAVRGLTKKDVDEEAEQTRTPGTLAMPHPHLRGETSRVASVTRFPCLSGAQDEVNSPLAPDPAKYVPIEMFQSVNSQLAQLRQAQNTARAESAVNEAMSAGKITPAQREWAVAYASQDLTGFVDFTAKAPTILSGETHGAGRLAPFALPVARQANTLTPEQKQVAAAMNIDAALYLKTLQDIKESE